MSSPTFIIARSAICIAVLVLATRNLKVVEVAGNEVVKPAVVEAKDLTWNDAIRSVFPADEAGRMIRICMKENQGQDRTAINYNTNGTYDYSWCQMNSVHKPSYMSNEEWKKNLENPMFNAKEVRKVFLREGWNAWSVYKFGLTK